MCWASVMSVFLLEASQFGKYWGKGTSMKQVQPVHSRVCWNELTPTSTRLVVFYVKGIELRNRDWNIKFNGFIPYWYKYVKEHSNINTIH